VKDEDQKKKITERGARGDDQKMGAPTPPSGMIFAANTIERKAKSRGNVVKGGNYWK